MRNYVQITSSHERLPRPEGRRIIGNDRPHSWPDGIVVRRYGDIDALRGVINERHTARVEPRGVAHTVRIEEVRRDVQIRPRVGKWHHLFL